MIRSEGAETPLCTFRATPSGRSGRRLRVGLFCLPLLFWPMVTLAQGENGAPAPANLEETHSVALKPLPTLQLDALEPAVRAVIEGRLALVDERLQGQEANAEEMAGLYGELGFLLHAHDLMDAAAVAYTNAEIAMPSDPRWSYASGLALWSLGRLEDAAQAIERTLDQLPRNATALIRLAEVRLEQNMPLVAKAHLRHALELSAESPAALALLGQVALSSKDYGRAVNYLQRALDQVPDANRLRYPLALAYRGLGDVEKARLNMAQRGDVGVKPFDPINDEIEKRKTGERVMLLEGRRAFKVGRYEEAAALFQKAWDADPTSVRARVNLASALAAMGKEDEAAAHFEEILQQNPENSAAAFNLASYRLKQGQNDEALSLLHTAAAADPRDGESRKLLADTYAKLGKLSESWQWTQEAVALLPTDQGLWLLGSELNQRLGRHGEARDWLQKGYRSMPDQGLLAHSLAHLLATSPEPEVRDGELAVQLATQVANTTQNLQHWHTVALALGEAGRCDDGISVLEQLLEKATPESQGALRSEISRYQQGPPCRPPFPR